MRAACGRWVRAATVARVGPRARVAVVWGLPLPKRPVGACAPRGVAKPAPVRATLPLAAISPVPHGDCRPAQRHLSAWHRLRASASTCCLWRHPPVLFRARAAALRPVARRLFPLCLDPGSVVCVLAPSFRLSAVVVSAAAYLLVVSSILSSPVFLGASRASRSYGARRSPLFLLSRCGSFAAHVGCGALRVRAWLCWCVRLWIMVICLFPF